MTTPRPGLRKACRAAGVVVLTCGTYGNVIRLLPPLVIPDHLLAEGLDVLEVAAVLDINTAAVKSALQRARARMEEVSPTADGIIEPDEPQARALLDRYIAAFENADAAALEAVLREDAALEMVGSRTWFSGLRTCLPFITSPQVLGSPGDWRMLPTAANGQPAAAAYLRGDSGTHVAYGIAVLTPGTDGLTRIVVFGAPDLVSAFGFPAVLSSSRAVDGVVEHHA